MKWVNDTVTLLKKHGYAWQARADIFIIIASIVLFFLFESYICLAIASISFIFLMWEVEDAKGRENRAELIRLLADKCDEVVLLQGELTKKNEEIEILKATAIPCKENPIKSNRIVSDKTFAVRLLNLMKSIQPCDASSEEELEYFRTTAERLLKWQTKTVKKDSNEYKYLENLGLMPQPSANAEEHTEDASKAEKPKKRPASKRKPKTETTENENQN
jgi:hypothetical protein